MVNFVMIGLLATSFSTVSGYAATTKCSSADQTLKYVRDYADGGAPRKALVELSVKSVVVYKTTFNNNNEVKLADFAFDSESQKEVSDVVNNENKTRTSIYTIKLDVSGTDTTNPIKQSDTVICENVRSSIPRP